MVPSIPKKQRTRTVRAIWESLQESEKPECALGDMNDLPQLIMGRSTKASTIANGLLIVGNISSSGEIRLEGQVRGDIQCASLVLGENSQLEGCAVAEDVVVGGCLMGSVRAVRLTLQAGSHVEGDLLYQSLAIEQGAYFEGESRPSEDALAAQPGLRASG